MGVIFLQMETNLNCVYCGQSNPKTRDHVPSKSLFARPYPKNLITVPCCKDCHLETTKDDEYFKTMLVLKDGNLYDTDKSVLYESVSRSFRRQVGLKRDILKTVKDVEVVSKSGIYLGKSMTYDVNRYRLYKVVGRYVRGLYFHFNKEIFPLDGSITCYEIGGLKSIPEELIHFLNNKHEVITIGNATLKIQIWKGNEEFIAIWLLTFFKDVQFIALLRPLKSSAQL